MQNAPPPVERFKAMKKLRQIIGAARLRVRLFVTVEPILVFDTFPLAEMIAQIHPDFLNIGADSKGRGLPEPDKTSITAFLEALRARHIEVRQKHNLNRLMT
jgi:DNA repair photolyase